MDAAYWHGRWAKGEIGFHREEVNPFLVAHFSALSLREGARVLVPLCGKTLDIGWLLAEGFRVVGVELNEAAVAELFDGLGIAPVITEMGALRHYGGDKIDVLVGDFFAVDGQTLGEVDATYDRAALVALPEAMRTRYAAHLVAISGAAPQLLLCFEYDQSKTDGPPFSVPEEAVQQYYGEYYRLTKLESADVPGGLRGECDAREHVWLLEWT